MSRSGLRLVVVPNSPIAEYEQAGYDRMEQYYNPTGMFQEVFALSPLEHGERKAFGMTIRGVSARDFAHTLREIKPDVVRAYGGHWPADFAVRHRLNRVPVIVSVHDKRSQLVRSSVRYADLVICVSGAVEREVRAVGTSPKRIRILPDRVNMSEFHPITDQGALQAIAARYPAGKHILHVGRKNHIKNLDTLIRALGLLPPHYSCVFVGRGDVTPYARLTKQIGVSSRCFWVDAIKNSDLPAWYSWCDCFCMPSRSEGFATVCLEAAACGAPIVTSAIEPMNEYLAHNLSACLVSDYENPHALADAIRRVCEDDPYGERLSAGAIQAAIPFEKSIVDTAEVAIYHEAMQLEAPALARRLEIITWRSGEALKARIPTAAKPLLKAIRTGVLASFRPRTSRPVRDSSLTPRARTPAIRTGLR